MNNYPPGAANDPRAPYNERPGMETEVTVRTTLVKETVVETSEGHMVCETEIEPDGTRSTVSFYETDEDLKETFLNAHRSAIQIIRDCKKICTELVRVGNRFYNKIYLPDLINDCEDWEEEEITVNNE